jgi:hypothetical protein
MKEEQQRHFPPTLMDDVFGSLSYAGPPKTIEEMDEEIAQEVRRRRLAEQTGQ